MHDWIILNFPIRGRIYYNLSNVLSKKLLHDTII